MMKNRRTFFRHIAAALVVAAAFGSSPARAESGFSKLDQYFYAHGCQSGISQATYRKAFAGVKTPDPAVLEKAAYQPEFKHKIWSMSTRVSIRTPADRTGKWRRSMPGTLNALERHYGVDKSILARHLVDGSNYGAISPERRPAALRAAGAGNPCLCRLKAVQIREDPAHRGTEDPAERRHHPAGADGFLGGRHWDTPSSFRRATCSMR